MNSNNSRDFFWECHSLLISTITDIHKNNTFNWIKDQFLLKKQPSGVQWYFLVLFSDFCLYGFTQDQRGWHIFQNHHKFSTYENFLFQFLKTFTMQNMFYLGMPLLTSVMTIIKQKQKGATPLKFVEADCPSHQAFCFTDVEVCSQRVVGLALLYSYFVVLFLKRSRVSFRARVGWQRRNPCTHMGYIY